MKIVALIALLVLAGCEARSSAYTLYRSSTTGPIRIHVATFDAIEGDEYNNENCQIAAELFQQQPEVKVRYWCEKGQYRA